MKKRRKTKVLRIWQIYHTWRKYTVVKRFRWRGFLVEILDNHAQDMKYEFQVVVPTRKLALSRGERRVFDRTSHRFLSICMDSAKGTIGELLTPLWYSHT